MKTGIGMNGPKDLYREGPVFLCPIISCWNSFLGTLGGFDERRIIILR